MLFFSLYNTLHREDTSPAYFFSKVGRNNMNSCNSKTHVIRTNFESPRGFELYEFNCIMDSNWAMHESPGRIFALSGKSETNLPAVLRVPNCYRVECLMKPNKLLEQYRNLQSLMVICSSF